MTLQMVGQAGPVVAQVTRETLPTARGDKGAAWGTGIAARNAGIAARNAGIANRGSRIAVRNAGVADRNAGVADRNTGVEDRSAVADIPRLQLLFLVQEERLVLTVFHHSRIQKNWSDV